MLLTLYSWNINGIRAAHKKGLLNWIDQTQADIYLFQETKAESHQVDLSITNHPNYETIWSSAERKGYSGVSTFIKKNQNPALKILSQRTEFPIKSLNHEGRIIQTEFPNFYLFNVYFPNGGSGTDRLNFKLKFYEDFLDYLQSLDKPIIIGGDVNTAHQEIDLARPKQNQNTSGFMDIERAWLHKIFSPEYGYIDTFRQFNQSPNQYTWWDMKTKSRDKNVGWRIDYFITSKQLKPNLINAQIHPQTQGSDHCPISLTLNL